MTFFCHRARFAHRGSRAAIVLAVLMGVLAPASEAAAQQDQTARIIRLGPVDVAPTLELRDLGVDTNVYNENSPEPSKDVTFTVVPIAVATLRASRSTFTLRSTTDLNFYARQESERSVNQNLTLNTRVALNRVVPYFDVGFTTTRQRFSEELDARARRLQRNLGAGVDVTIGRKLTAQVSGALRTLSFADDAVFDGRSLSQELNNDSTSVGLGLRFEATPLTTLVATTELAENRFDEETSLRNSKARSAMFGADFVPAAIVSGSIRVGFQSFSPDSPALPDFTGMVGSANITYRMGPLTGLTGRYDRSVAYSYFAEEPYYVRHSFGATIQRQLTRDWDVSLGGDHSWHDYRRAGTSSGTPGTGHEDRLIVAQLGAGYSVGPRTKITSGLSYSDRKSDIEYRSYSGWRVGTSIFYGF